MEKINQFLASISNWTNAISLLVSVATLITALRFKRRIKIEGEKEYFRRRKSAILKEVIGFSESLFDGIYDEKFLDSIDLFLSESITEYTFWSLLLRLRIRYVCFLINYKYKAECAEGRKNSRHKLSKHLRKISALMRKE